MKRKLFFLLFLFIPFSAFPVTNKPAHPIRVLIITGGHDFKVEQFKQMFDSFGKEIQYEIAELPSAYDKFLPWNRDQYDILVFYHMWQDINEEQAKNLSECISQGKPLVVLHHSICAYDDWPEYLNITGGKYFHKKTVLKGKEYPECSYIHDMHFKVKIVDSENPVTKGLTDFEIFDETYKGFYVDEGVTPLLTTEEPSSTPLIGWSKTYGKARVVTLQSGHDVATFENPNFRKLLKQAIEWVYDGI